MNCDDARPLLTAYLDGELDGDSGSAVRGHLRGCAGCRGVAGDEATLRDGLRALPPLDPPPALWTAVQRRLAAAEIADAKRPAWRRALGRWAPLAPRFGLAGTALAAAAALLVWHHRGTQLPESARLPIASELPIPATAPPAATTTDDRDVAVALAAAPARATQRYADAADELLQIARDARAGWSDDRKQTFDAKLAVLRHDVAAATDGRPRHQAYRALIRYLQAAAIRDEVSVNDRMLAAPGGGSP